MDARPFDLTFLREHAFGILAGVSMPAGKDPVPADILARLHPDEVEIAQGLRGFRQVEWACGRLAWHAAAARLGVERSPLLAGPEREPLAPRGLSVSVSHKRDLAIALVGDAARGTLGVDVEKDTEPAEGIAQRILRREEIRAVDALPASERGAAVLLRFSVKEATYKAVYPRLRRYVSYNEARVEVAPGGEIRVTMFLEDGAPSPRLDAVIERMPGRIISAVRCARE